MRAAVIGLGAIGPTIAATLARGGIDVVGYDIRREQIDRARDELPGLFHALDRSGARVVPKQGEVCFEDSLRAAVRDADLVVEAVAERVELKHMVFTGLDRLAPERALIASCTAQIPIERLQQPCRHPGRIAGMHWPTASAPPQTVELVPGVATDPATIEALASIITNIGLVPVRLSKDIGGSVHGRLLLALWRESLALIDSGAIAPEELDRCVRSGLGRELAVAGPLEWLDAAGLDTFRDAASDLITSRIAAGHLGVKTGEGVYKYSADRVDALHTDRIAKLVAIHKTLDGR